tara:strand:+ start:265 stop:1344 length:1080 start_codon:yes stop_codon:yes gene_type:complete
MDVQASDKLFSTQEVIDLYMLQNSKKSTLHKARKSGDGPTPIEKKRGGKPQYFYKIDDIGTIGKKYGFLTKKGRKPIVLAFHTTKGGTLKTSISYIVSRVLAYHGLKVLVIPMDVQASLTFLALNKLDLEDLRECKDLMNATGLNELIQGKAKFKDTVINLDIPGLDIIPETPSLSTLDLDYIDKKRRGHRELILKNWLDELLKKPNIQYDAVVFDTPPHFGWLTQNALCCATKGGVFSPMGCDVGSYFTANTTINGITNFRQELAAEKIKVDWKGTTVLPTLLGNTKLSKQIHAYYMHEFETSTASIRRAVQGEQNLFKGITPFETKNNSKLKEDYYYLLTDIWKTAGGLVQDRPHLN